MADLNFKHHVSEIPRGEQLPEPIKSTEHVQQSNIPNFQATYSNFGADTNWMSSLGSAIATRSSSAIATKLGGELGKNPVGEIAPPITNFDKVMSDSYARQAQATLGLQAQKLITQSNLELAAEPRIDSSMITKTQQNTLKGLQKIFSLAPDSVRPQMESQYGSVMLNQNETLVRRMEGEQKQDRIDSLNVSSKVNAETSHSLAVGGNEDGALAAMHATIEAANASYARHDISLEKKKVLIDTAEQTYYAGNLTRYLLEQEKEGKLPQAMKSIADNPKKHNIPDKYHREVIGNALQYMQLQETLKSQDQALLMAKFDVALAKKSEISPDQLLQLEESLSPINYQRTFLKYITSLNKDNQSNQEQQLLHGGFDNPDIWSRTSDSAKNSFFDDSVRFMVENSKEMKVEEAEAVVASQALGPIKTFSNVVTNRLKSLNPEEVERGIRQVEYMYNSHKGGNLSDVEDRALSRGALFEVYRTRMPLQDAANLSYDKIYNIKKEDYEILSDQWKIYKRDKIGSNPIKYYANLADIDVDKLVDPLGFQVQADMLYQGYFFEMRGEKEALDKRFIRDINAYYGESSVNGRSEVSYLPIENFLGLPTTSSKFKVREDLEVSLGTKFQLKEFAFILNTVSNNNKPYSSTGIIQDDIVEKVSQQIDPLKKLYLENKANDYWEIEPRPSLEHAKSHKNIALLQDSLEKYSNGTPIIIHRVYRNGTRDTYELAIKSNPFLSTLKNGKYTGGWDLVVRPKDGVGISNFGLLLGNLNHNFVYRPSPTDLRNRYLKEYKNVRRR